MTLALSWGVGGVYLAARALGAPLPELAASPAFLLMACAPSLAAVLLAVRAGTLADLLKTLVRPASLLWLALAFLLLPALALALIFGADAVGAPWPVRAHDVLVALPLLMFASPQIVANPGALGEELGWRGYALPRLLALSTPLRAGLIVGGAWAIWHVPAFFLSGVMAASWAAFGWWALTTLALSLVMTWLYLRANGNVVVAGIVPHFVINAAGALGIWTARPLEASALALLAVAIIVLGGLRRA